MDNKKQQEKNMESNAGQRENDMQPNDEQQGSDMEPNSQSDAVSEYVPCFNVNDMKKYIENQCMLNAVRRDAVSGVKEVLLQEIEKIKSARKDFQALIERGQQSAKN